MAGPQRLRCGLRGACLRGACLLDFQYDTDLPDEVERVQGITSILLEWHFILEKISFLTFSTLDEYNNVWSLKHRSGCICRVFGTKVVILFVELSTFYINKDRWELFGAISDVKHSLLTLTFEVGPQTWRYCTNALVNG